MLTSNFFLPIHGDGRHDGADCCCRDDALLNYEGCKYFFAFGISRLRSVDALTHLIGG
jgi:hypothetical protein